MSDCPCKGCSVYQTYWAVGYPAPWRVMSDHCSCAFCLKWHETEFRWKEGLCLNCRYPITLMSIQKNYIYQNKPCEDCKERLPKLAKEAGMCPTHLVHLDEGKCCECACFCEAKGIDCPVEECICGCNDCRVMRKHYDRSMEAMHEA